MLRLAIATALITACAHDATLERKVDDLAAQLGTTERELGEVRQRIEQLAPPPHDAELDRKLDQLAKKIDAIDVRGPGFHPVHRLPEPDKDKTYAIQVDGHPSDGPADAKITLVIAHDYADPFSEKMREVLVELRKKYGGDLRIVYRDYVVHPQVATAGAIASCAADKQRKFAAYDDLLWERGFKRHDFEPDQQCWKTASGCPLLDGFATELKLDVKRFKADMVKCEATVRDDGVDLQAFGLHGTPTFFINGRYLVGALPTESFEPVIDDELAKATARIKAGTAKAKYYKEWVIGKGLTQLESP